MKAKNIFFCFIICILFPTSITQAQWVQTSGPYGGNVTCFATSGNNLFVGGGGVFLSTNNGTSWTAVSTGLTEYYDTHVQALAVSGTNLFAGTWGGVFLSTNNGTSWNAVNTGLTNFNVSAFAVSGTNLFAGTYGGVFLSTNNGTSWTEANTGLTSFDVNAFAVSGTNLFAGTSDGVFLSTNNGTSWSAASTGLTYPYVLDFAVSGTNLFAGTVNGGVFLSTNNGTSWTAVNTGLPNTSVYALAVVGTNFFAGTYDGVFLSTNNGASWSAASTGLTNTNISAFAVSGTNLFAGTAGFGVFLSTNNGTSWTAANTGLTSFNVSAFAVSATNLFAGTLGGGVFRSTNNGTSWTATSTGLTNTVVKALAVSGTNLFAGTRPGGVFLSTNNGTSWTVVNNGLPNTSVYALAVSGTNLFAGTYGGGVFRSTNNGTSWSAASTGLTYPYVEALDVRGTDLFAGTYGYGIWRRPLSEMIPTVIVRTPTINISSSVISNNGNLQVTGSNFTPAGSVNLDFTGPSGVAIPKVTITADANGVISYNFNSLTYPPGIYNVVGYDIVSNKYTITKSFEILSNTPVFDPLKVTAPTIGYQAYPGQEFIVSWTDKMILSAIYQTVGAKRKYKYYLDLSSNGGSTWNRIDSLDGLGQINEFINLSKRIIINQPGQNNKIKIIDYYDINRDAISAMFTVLNQPLNNIKADYVWDYSYSNRQGHPIGCTADGTSRMYMRVFKINQSIGLNISKVEFSLNDGTSGLKTNGKLKIATIVNQWSNEAAGANLLSVQVNTAINDTFWVWYVAPDDFVRDAFSDDKFSGSREVHLTIKVTYSDNTFEIVPVTSIKIYRPPLMLVYGLADNTGLWDNYPLTTTYSYLFPNVSTPPIGNIDYYVDNAKGLLKLNNSLNGYTFEDVIKKTRDEKKIACNQLYYVGHSMGGLFPRFCETFLNDSYETNRNYSQGFINKLITIDTPHKGSPWADYLYELNTPLALILRIRSVYPGNVLNSWFDLFNRVSPAVDNLRINSWLYFGSSTIKANAIVSDIIEGDEPDINNINSSLIEQLNYLIKPGYLFLLDPLHNWPFLSPKNHFMNINENLFAYNNQSHFIANSDFIVSTQSQSSGLEVTAPNISYVSGHFHSKKTGLPSVVEFTSDKVLTVLNSSSDSPLLGYFPQTYSSNKTIFPNNSSTEKFLKLDTTFITPIEPIPFSSFPVNSIYNISFSVNDTTGLSNVGIIFQTNSFQTSDKNFNYQFIVQTDGKYLDTQKVFIYALYLRGDSVLLTTKEIPVIVTTDESILSFNVTPKVFIMRNGDKATPTFKGVFNSFLSEVGYQGTSISAIIENENIVKFNFEDKIFEAVGNGETSAIINYKEKSDTVYFTIQGDKVTGIFEEDNNSANSNMPNKFELFQNYPNPFNPSTTIKYSIPQTSFVKIQIYDILGREVKTLVNEEKRAGNYEVEFNGSKLSSGVYFYSITVNNFHKTNKMILAK